MSYDRLIFRKFRTRNNMLFLISTIRMMTVIALLSVFSVIQAEAQHSQKDMHGGGDYPMYEYDSNHPAYKDIIKEMSKGRDHVEGPVEYNSEFPTSGAHYPYPTRPGFYKKRPPLEKIVHSLEHGNIVIYYDTPDEESMKKIKSWTDRYKGSFDGVIAVPHSNLGESLVFTAWRLRLHLSKMDVRASFFIDAFRGRGPERTLR
jgi:hypothetical protein